MQLPVVDWTQFGPLIRQFLFYAAGMTVYCVFILLFYEQIGRRVLFPYQSRSFAGSGHPGFLGFCWKLLYAIKYVLLTPFVLCVWSAVLTGLIFLFTGDVPLDFLIIVGTALLAAIRIVAYWREDLAKMLVQNFSFSLLVVFLISPTSVSWNLLLSKVGQVPAHLATYLFFFTIIVVLELVLRLFDAMVRKE